MTTLNYNYYVCIQQTLINYHSDILKLTAATVEMHKHTVPPKSSFGSHFKVDDAGAPSSSHKIRFKYGPVTD